MYTGDKLLGVTLRWTSIPSRGSSNTNCLTLKMTSAQVVEASVKVTSNSPSQDSTHPDDHNLPTYNCFMLQKLSLALAVWAT